MGGCEGGAGSKGAVRGAGHITCSTHSIRLPLLSSSHTTHMTSLPLTTCPLPLPCLPAPAPLPCPDLQVLAISGSAAGALQNVSREVASRLLIRSGGGGRGGGRGEQLAAHQVKGQGSGEGAWGVR